MENQSLEFEFNNDKKCSLYTYIIQNWFKYHIACKSSKEN